MIKAVAWVAVGAVALIVVGWLVTWIVGGLLKIAFYLVVGAAAVFGARYLVGRARARGAIRRGPSSRELR